MSIFQFIVIALKFLIPSFMLINPFFGMWGNYFLDIVDGDLLVHLGLSEFTYQSIDKFADLVSYVFMLLMAWGWRIRKTVVALFLYRFVGQILFFITRNELMFFYFQNFLEPLLLIYTFLIFKKASEAKAFQVYKRHLKLIWIIVIGYKLWNEWYLHYANIDLSTIFFGFNGGS